MLNLKEHSMSGTCRKISMVPNGGSGRSRMSASTKILLLRRLYFCNITIDLTMTLSVRFEPPFISTYHDRFCRPILNFVDTIEYSLRRPSRPRHPKLASIFKHRTQHSTTTYRYPFSNFKGSNFAEHSFIMFYDFLLHLSL